MEQQAGHTGTNLLSWPDAGMAGKQMHHALPSPSHLPWLNKVLCNGAIMQNIINSRTQWSEQDFRAMFSTCKDLRRHPVLQKQVALVLDATHPDPASSWPAGSMARVAAPDVHALLIRGSACTNNGTTSSAAHAVLDRKSMESTREGRYVMQCMQQLHRLDLHPRDQQPRQQQDVDQTPGRKRPLEVSQSSCEHATGANTEPGAADNLSGVHRKWLPRFRVPTKAAHASRRGYSWSLERLHIANLHMPRCMLHLPTLLDPVSNLSGGCIRSLTLTSLQMHDCVLSSLNQAMARSSCLRVLKATNVVVYTLSKRQVMHPDPDLPCMVSMSPLTHHLHRLLGAEDEEHNSTLGADSVRAGPSPKVVRSLLKVHVDNGTSSTSSHVALRAGTSIGVFAHFKNITHLSLCGLRGPALVTTLPVLGQLTLLQELIISWLPLRTCKQDADPDAQFYQGSELGLLPLAACRNLRSLVVLLWPSSDDRPLVLSPILAAAPSMRRLCVPLSASLEPNLQLPVRVTSLEIACPLRGPHVQQQQQPGQQQTPGPHRLHVGVNGHVVQQLAARQLRAQLLACDFRHGSSVVLRLADWLSQLKGGQQEQSLELRVSKLATRHQSEFLMWFLGQVTPSSSRQIITKAVVASFGDDDLQAMSDVQRAQLQQGLANSWDDVCVQVGHIICQQN